MERGRKLGIASRNRGSGNRQNHHQFDASSSQVKVENEETSFSLSQSLHQSESPLSYLSLLNEESTPDEKPKVVLPSRDRATLDSASERIGSSNIRVQSRTNSENYGSGSKVPVAGRSSRESEHSSYQNYSEELRNWKERSNNNNNRGVPSKQSNKRKNKSWAIECERMQRIDDNIRALGELLPRQCFVDTPESILNDTIAHVKLLHLQMKELSRNRLGGEPISHPMISVEGYGHFIHQEHTMTKPLEEIMADLLTKDPDAAFSLLESKGLYVMPFSSV